MGLDYEGLQKSAGELQHEGEETGSPGRYPLAPLRVRSSSQRGPDSPPIIPDHVEHIPT